MTDLDFQADTVAPDPTPRPTPRCHLLNRRDAAQYLFDAGLEHYGPNTLKTQALAGKGPRFIKIGNHAYYDLDALDHYLETGDEKETAAA